MTSLPNARLAALVLVAGLAFSGCEKRTPTSAALQDAQIKLQALAPSGVAGPSVAARTAVYNSVLTSLKSVADQGRNGETASAYLLIAQAHAGVAQGPSSEAALLERTALAHSQAVRDAYSQWLSANALADAAASYDPSKELAEIDAQIKERQDLRKAEEQRKAGVDSQVADILAQAKAKADQAKAKRQESGTLKSKLANQTATVAETTLRQAQGIGRVADGFEVEASNLEARAAQVAPQSGEIQLQIEKLTSQEALLGSSKTAVQKRSETAKAHAAEARAAAGAAAAEVKKRVTALEALRDGDLAKASDEAIGAYKAAAAAARKAAPDAKNASQMSVGGAQQLLGDSLWSRAQGLAEYANLLETLANAKPALPEAATYKSKAAKAREDAKAALDQATEAYKAANDALTAGSGAANKERMDSVNRRLAEIVKVTSGGRDDIRTPDAPKDEAPATGTPSETSAAPIDPNSPQATIQALLDVEKNNAFDTIGDLFLTENDQDKQALKSVLALAPKMKKLSDAMKAKFGAGLEALAQQMGGMAPPGMGMDSMKDLNAATLNVKIEGDTATADLPTGQPLKLVKKDGKWLIDGSSMGLGSQQLAAAQMIVGPMGKVVDEVAAEVQAGKYKDAAAAMQALQQKAMAGMGIPKPPGGK